MDYWLKIGEYESGYGTRVCGINSTRYIVYVTHLMHPKSFYHKWWEEVLKVRRLEGWEINCI